MFPVIFFIEGSRINVCPLRAGLRLCLPGPFFYTPFGCASCCRFPPLGLWFDKPALSMLFCFFPSQHHTYLSYFSSTEPFLDNLCPFLPFPFSHSPMCEHDRFSFFSLFLFGVMFPPLLSPLRGASGVLCFADRYLQSCPCNSTSLSHFFVSPGRFSVSQASRPSAAPGPATILFSLLSYLLTLSALAKPDILFPFFWLASSNLIEGAVLLLLPSLSLQ